MSRQPRRPPRKLNARPSPKKRTFVYRKHKKPDKKIVTTPKGRSTRNYKPPESILVPRPLHLSKPAHGDKKITIRDTIKRLRSGKDHVPRLAYYDESKRKILEFKDEVGLVLPSDNYCLERESSILSAGFIRANRSSLSLKRQKTFEASLAIGEPHALKKYFNNQSKSKANAECSRINSIDKLREAEDAIKEAELIDKSPFCYREWKDYDYPERESSVNINAKEAMMDLDRVEKYCELNSKKWLPTNGIEFLNEERFAKNLLKGLDEDDDIAKIFSEYRPAVKPGSEADKFRNKSLARMGLLIDIKEMKTKALALKWKKKAQMARQQRDQERTNAVHTGTSNETYSTEEICAQERNAAVGDTEISSI